MEVIITKNQDEASLLAAHRLKNQVLEKKDSVLGLATGSTPLSLYRQFASLVRAKEIEMDHVLSFNLDEYVGVGAEHKGSYSYYMRKNWIEPLGLKDRCVHIPNGLAKDMKEECNHYEQMIQEEGPIDLQILGIGRDGHIGFNEPGSSFGSRTRLKTLTEVTREDNREAFADTGEIPRHVITMGIQTILEAKEIVLLAFGEEKAQAVRDCVEGPVSASCPASALQFHPKVKLFLDSSAASLLQNKDYYIEVFQNKPSWQMREFSE